MGQVQSFHEYEHYVRDCHGREKEEPQFGKDDNQQAPGCPVQPWSQVVTLVTHCEVTEVPYRTTSGLTAIFQSTIRGVYARFIADTGAAVTIVSSHAYNSIPAVAQPILRQPSVTYLTVGDDGGMQIEDFASLTFQEGEQFFEWDMYMAPIKEDRLLGLDFLFALDL